MAHAAIAMPMVSMAAARGSAQRHDGHGGDFGAMGLHYVNGSLLDGNVDVQQPEIVLFEPMANGGTRITGADYLVLAGRGRDADVPSLD